MSVLVKGMAMPTKCGECNLFQYEYPMHCRAINTYRTVGAPYGMPRPDWCPLVEVRSWHGDLIDSSEIRWVEHHDSDGNLSKYMVAYSDEMPQAVIEAEGET